jgi:hypothetical protein
MITNPLRECGLSPQFIAALSKQGGITAVRQAVRAQKRSASKFLHPDISGKQTAFYTKLLASAETIERMSDTELDEYLAKLKQREDPPAPAPVMPSGKILHALIAVCSKGHIPSAKEVTFYPLIPPERKFKSAPFSIIRPTATGIEHRKVTDETWQRDEGLFLIGSFSRKIDHILRQMLPAELRSINTLPGRTSKGAATIRILPIPDTAIEAVEDLYTPEILTPNAIALVSATGALFHAGHIHEK